VISVVNDLKEVRGSRKRFGVGGAQSRTSYPDESAFGGGAERDTRGAYAPRNLFEQLPQILKNIVFFVRARAIGHKELLAEAHTISKQTVDKRSQRRGAGKNQ
jgi:hypothetical protein